MKATEFRTSIDELYACLIALTETKGEEYKRREDNQFSNFERGAHALGLTREQVLMVYLSKHLDSITTYVKDRAAGQEKQYAEPISGRIDDAILYLLLLRGMTIDNDREFARRVVASIEAGASEEFVERHVVGEEFPRRVPMRELRTIRWPESYRPMPGGVDLSHALDPITEAFRQMAEGGRVSAEQAEAGLHDNARLSVEPEQARGPENTVFISSMQTAAIEEAKKMGLPAASCALSTPDQLYGMTPGTRVIFLHHGNKNCDFLHDEVRAKCEKQHLKFEVWYP